MPDISFESFAPRSFEQFSQALAAKVFGAGTMIFGDGPDGGREASFEGAIAYPGTGNRSPGYIVLQAKFRQRPVANCIVVALGRFKERTVRGDVRSAIRRPEIPIVCLTICS